MEQNLEQPVPAEYPHKSPATKRRRLIIVGSIAAAVIIVAVILIMIFNSTQGPANNGQKDEDNTPRSLTVGSQPYIYPCSVATRDDYARIFGLDDASIGTVSEESALPAKDLKEGGDLDKLAPDTGSDPRFFTECSYTLAKKGATQVNSIRVEIIQRASNEDAQKDLKSSRSQAARDYTSDGIDNGKYKLAALPASIAKDSYILNADPGSNLTVMEVGFLAESRMIKLKYQFTNSDTAEQATANLISYSEAIKTKLNEKTDALDMTGQATTAGVKFVDVCRKLDLKKLAANFSNIEFRPDDVTAISRYGSLPGSLAAADGVKSDCMLSFNTSDDRQAQDGEKGPGGEDSLSSNERWPHDMLLSVNTFPSEQVAKQAYDTKKLKAGRPVGGEVAIVQDKAIGDAAYNYNKTIDLSLGNQQKTRLNTEDSLVVLSGRDIIVVSIQQLKADDVYQTVPLDISDDQFKNVYTRIHATLADNRK